MSSSPVSVIIPTWRRPSILAATLHRLLSCTPPPAEILIHVDAGDAETAPTLNHLFGTAVRVFTSDQRQGPGGGRNLLARAASHAILASFDDDSYPSEPDYFTRALALTKQHPHAAVLASSVIWRGQSPAPGSASYFPVRSFENCGCILRRDAFLQTRGYLPLIHAYGMEEADLALQLMDLNYQILFCPALRVFHDTSADRHSDPATNAAHIRNTALLAWLRYPKRYWPLGLAQTLNRTLYAIRKKRFQGICTGLASIPAACWKNCHLRHPVKPTTLRLSRSLP